MSVLLRILIGLAIMAVGFLLVWKTYPVQGWVGQIDWAEEKLGSGGTYTFIKLVGIIVAFIGIAVATNLISDIMGGLVGIFVR